MTEKRFWHDGAKVFDSEELLCCTLSIWVEQLVDLLNELAEENKELKEENQKLLSLIQKGVDSWNSEKKDEHLAWKRVDVE